MGLGGCVAVGEEGGRVGVGWVCCCFLRFFFGGGVRDEVVGFDV